MPKQVYKITRFDGGLNSDSDPRDIDDNELAGVTDIDITAIGRITMLGGFTEHESTSGAVDGDADAGTGSAGTGLFSWSSDYRMLADDEDFDGGAEQRTDYIALYEDTSSTSKLALFQKQVDGEKGWEDGASTFALGGATGQYSFYAVDGNVRVFDYSGVAYTASADNKGKWLGVATPKTYLEDSVGEGSTRAYGSYNTTATASVFRTGGTDTISPIFKNQGIEGCFPTEENSDGDQVCTNAVVVSTGSQYVQKTSDEFKYIKDTDASESSDASKSIIKCMDASPRFIDFVVGDTVNIAGFTGDDDNNGDVVITAINGAKTIIEFAGQSGEATDGQGEVVTITRIIANTGDPGFTGGIAFANEFSDIGSSHSSATAAASGSKWGAGLVFAEDTNGNNTGTWMPTTGTRYKFYISTVYDNGMQESLPQLMAMYGSESLSNTTVLSGGAHDVHFTTCNSELYFSTGVPRKTQTNLTHAVQAQDIALHIKPIVKINGATYEDTANNDNLAFGGTAETATSGGNPRISGVKYYYSSSEDGHSDLWTLFDCDFHTGTKSYGMNALAGTGGRAPWQNYSFYYNSDYKTTSYGHYAIPDWDEGNKFISPPKFLSYYAANQHEHSDSITLNHAKSFVVANNRVYAGNYNQTIDGKPTQFSDRIIMSPIGQPDKFPQNNFIPTAVNDGDEIVTLAVYSDRLLQFNNNVLYVHNISQADSYLEGTYKFKGVESPASVCTTDKGVAWANKLGAYFYDGNKVHDLLRKKGTSLISQRTWSNFVDTAIMTGYISSKHQLIFGSDISTGDDDSVDGEAYIYSLVTRSWVRASSGTVADAIKSNFASDYNGDLIYYDYNAGNMQVWDPLPDSSNKVNMLTKDIDFGQPSVRKKVYKVYISYKGDASAVTLNYSVDGKNDVHAGQFYRIGSTGASTGATESDTPFYGSTVGTDNWVNAEFKPTAAINNIYSFQLKFDGEATANFEINDISIVYRMKNIK